MGDLKVKYFFESQEKLINDIKVLLETLQQEDNKEKSNTETPKENTQKGDDSHKGE